MITRARLIATKNLRGLLAGPSTKDERGIHPNRVRQCQSIKCLDSIWGCHTNKCQGNHPESMLGRGASTPFFCVFVPWKPMVESTTLSKKMGFAEMWKQELPDGTSLHIFDIIHKSLSLVRVSEAVKPKVSTPLRHQPLGTSICLVLWNISNCENLWITFHLTSAVEAVPALLVNKFGLNLVLR